LSACRTEDITSLRAASRALRVAFAPAGWQSLIVRRFGAAALLSGRPDDLRALMRAFSARNSPKLSADQLDDDWTEDVAYFLTQSVDFLPIGFGMDCGDLSQGLKLNTSGVFQVPTPPPHAREAIWISVINTDRCSGRYWLSDCAAAA